MDAGASASRLRSVGGRRVLPTKPPWPKARPGVGQEAQAEQRKAAGESYSGDLASLTQHPVTPAGGIDENRMLAPCMRAHGR